MSWPMCVHSPRNSPKWMMPFAQGSVGGGGTMTCNVGSMERPIRVVVGIVLPGVGTFAGCRRSVWAPPSSRVRLR